MSRIYLYDEHKTKGRIGGGNKGTKFQLQSKNRYDMRHGQFNFWRFLPLRFVRFPLLAFAYCSRPPSARSHPFLLRIRLLRTT